MVTDDTRPWTEFIVSYEEETAETLNKLNQVLYDADETLKYDEMMDRAGYDPDDLSETVRSATISLVSDDFAYTTADWQYFSAFE